MMIWSVVCLIVLGLVYIRLAPSDVARWHVAPQVERDEDLKGGVKRILEAPGELARLDKIIRATERTTVLAGSVEEGMITYITRSRLIGFPDYTTVLQDGDTLKLKAHLRFGRSDLGVNKRRVEEWLQILSLAQPAG